MAKQKRLEVDNTFIQALQEKFETDKPKLKSSITKYTWKKQLAYLLNEFIQKELVNLEAEDILQDVFYQLTEAYQLMKPIENVSAWMYRVAKNKITDLFRKKKPDYVDMREKVDEEEGSRFLSIINTTYRYISLVTFTIFFN